jgi:hypothetical protein
MTRHGDYSATSHLNGRKDASALEVRLSEEHLAVMDGGAKAGYHESQEKVEPHRVAFLLFSHRPAASQQQRYEHR